jgi:hypothetical protein
MATEMWLVLAIIEKIRPRQQFKRLGLRLATITNQPF